MDLQRQPNIDIRFKRCKVDVMIDVKSLPAYATCCFVFSREKPELFLFP